MITGVLLLLFGVVILGFVVWVFAFGGQKRRGQSAETEVQKRPPSQGRASGEN